MCALEDCSARQQHDIVVDVRGVRQQMVEIRERGSPSITSEDAKGYSLQWKHRSSTIGEFKAGKNVTKFLDLKPY